MIIPLKLTLYGLLYALSVNYFFIRSVSYLPKYIESKYIKLYTNNFILYAILSAIVGARVMSIILYYPMYKYNFPTLFSRSSGMCFFGGVLGVWAYFSIAEYFYGINTLQVIDKIIINLPICIFFIRIANFINSECLGLHYISDSQYRYHTQIYESIFEGIIPFIILNYRGNILKKNDGVVTGLFLVLYSLPRFIIEYFKVQELPLIYSLSIWQYFCIYFFFYGLFLIGRSYHEELFRINEICFRKR